MSRVTLARSRAELNAALAEARRDERRIGFVPTMGALHDGHASLIKVARESVDRGVVVVSVFVNPTQFGPDEDFERYPRTLDEDTALCELHGADVVFAPAIDEVYPEGSPEVTVLPGPKGDLLEGPMREGHFSGVLTVVAKLFGLVNPDVAVFGEKDYQQLVLIRQMVSDLCMRVDVVGAPIWREATGLAMSSRNRYLSGEEREAANGLSRALFDAAEEAPHGAKAAIDAARAVLRSTPGIDLDYLTLVAPDLGPEPDSGPARVLIAARVGSTRLIDNVAVEIGGSTSGGEN